MEDTNNDELRKLQEQQTIENVLKRKDMEHDALVEAAKKSVNNPNANVKQEQNKIIKDKVQEQEEKNRKQVEAVENRILDAEVDEMLKIYNEQERMAAEQRRLKVELILTLMQEEAKARDRLRRIANIDSMIKKQAQKFRVKHASKQSKVENLAYQLKIFEIREKIKRDKEKMLQDLDEKEMIRKRKKEQEERNKQKQEAKKQETEKEEEKKTENKEKTEKKIDKKEEIKKKQPLEEKKEMIIDPDELERKGNGTGNSRGRYLIEKNDDLYKDRSKRIHIEVRSEPKEKRTIDQKKVNYKMLNAIRKYTSVMEFYERNKYIFQRRNMYGQKVDDKDKFRQDLKFAVNHEQALSNAEKNKGKATFRPRIIE